MKLFFICVALFMLQSSCSKKDSKKSKTDLLTAGTWKLTAAIDDDDGDGSYEINTFSSFPVCYTDNFYTFGSNGQLESNEGPTKCDAADPQTETTTWQLTQNETHIQIDGDEYKLEELTGTMLRWKEEYQGGRSAIVTLTRR